MGVPKGEASAQIRGRVIAARQRQQERYAGTGIFANAAMQSKQIRQYCPIDEAAKALLKSAIDPLGLSARAYDRILKLSRTIADLAESEAIELAHVAEGAPPRSGGPGTGRWTGSCGGRRQASGGCPGTCRAKSR